MVLGFSSKPAQSGLGGLARANPAPLFLLRAHLRLPVHPFFDFFWRTSGWGITRSIISGGDADAFLSGKLLSAKKLLAANRRPSPPMAVEQQSALLTRMVLLIQRLQHVGRPFFSPPPSIDRVADGVRRPLLVRTRWCGAEDHHPRGIFTKMATVAVHAGPARPLSLPSALLRT